MAEPGEKLLEQYDEIVHPRPPAGSQNGAISPSDPFYLWIGGMQDTGLPGLTVGPSHANDAILSNTIYYDGLWGAAAGIVASRLGTLTFDIDKASNSRGEYIRKKAEAHDLILYANGRKGFAPWIAGGGLDFGLTDNGWWWYIERGGGMSGGKAVGLWSLDTLRVHRTGDPERPVQYWSPPYPVGDGRVHVLPWWSVVNIVNAPLNRASAMGAGVCAARFAYEDGIKILHAMTRHFYERITGTGIKRMIALRGIATEDFEASLQQAVAKAQGDGRSIYFGNAVIGVPDTRSEIQLVEVNLSDVPDGFDFATMYDTRVDLYAGAWGIDKQELKPLQGALSGTAGQSMWLHEISQSRGLQYLVVETNHKLNDPDYNILGEGIVQGWSDRDARAEKAKADKDAVVVQAATGMIDKGLLDVPSGQQYLLAEGVVDKDMISQTEAADDALSSDETADEQGSGKPADTEGSPPAPEGEIVVSEKERVTPKGAGKALPAIPATTVSEKDADAIEAEWKRISSAWDDIPQDVSDILEAK